jgi:phosphatidylglycerol:prolipoprotein diacylglycerol transferase
VRPIVLSFPFAGTTVSLPSYGLLVAIGFAAGVAYAVRRARREGLDGGAVADIAFWVLVTGLAGSRAVFVALNAGRFAALCAGTGSGGGAGTNAAARGLGQVLGDCTAALRVWEGGLVFYGGAVAAAAAAIGLARRKGVPFAPLADLLAPALALGHAIGRLGCLDAGCCYGKACAGPGFPCAAFPPASVAHADLSRHGLLGAADAATPPLHLTQLYEAAGELALFALLLARRPRRRFAGELALVYAAGYAALRFGVEIFRGDRARGFVAELATPGLAAALGLPPAEPVFLSTAQALSVAVATAAAVVWWRRRAQGGSSSHA